MAVGGLRPSGGCGGRKAGMAMPPRRGCWAVKEAAGAGAVGTAGEVKTRGRSMCTGHFSGERAVEASVMAAWQPAMGQ